MIILKDFTGPEPPDISSYSCEDCPDTKPEVERRNGYWVVYCPDCQVILAEIADKMDKSYLTKPQPTKWRWRQTISHIERPDRPTACCSGNITTAAGWIKVNKPVGNVCANCEKKYPYYKYAANVATERDN